MSTPQHGPLRGVKVVELAGIGPAPFCCMLLADMGADVIRVDRLGSSASLEESRRSILNRNRRSIAVDLKHPEGVRTISRLIASADVLVEGFRPGVTERMGLGPEDCLELNPGLVYGRMTGWGQDGPLAQTAGHDINFISVTGILNAVGPQGGDPVPPLNLIGDFGGGALYLAFGIVCALNERHASGKGQVIDSAMVDGSASLMSSVMSFMARQAWTSTRGQNLLDGGAPWYRAYKTRDGKYVSVGAIEPAFYSELVKRMSLDEKALPSRASKSDWPELARIFEQAFLSKTQAEWCELLERHDVCFSPVLDITESKAHAQVEARGLIVEHHGIDQPAPVPRFSRTPGRLDLPPPAPGEHTTQVLLDWGLTASEIEALMACKAVGQRGRGAGDAR